MFELLLKAMERACEIPPLNTPSPVPNILLSDTAFEISSLQSSNRWAHLPGSYRTLRDGSSRRTCPRHFVPGYDHSVPLGRYRFRAEAGGRLKRPVKVPRMAADGLAQRPYSESALP